MDNWMNGPQTVISCKPGKCLEPFHFEQNTGTSVVTCVVWWPCHWCAGTVKWHAPGYVYSRERTVLHTKLSVATGVTNTVLFKCVFPGQEAAGSHPTPNRSFHRVCATNTAWMFTLQVYAAHQSAASLTNFAADPGKRWGAPQYRHSAVSASTPLVHH